MFTQAPSTHRTSAKHRKPTRTLDVGAEKPKVTRSSRSRSRSKKTVPEPIAVLAPEVESVEIHEIQAYRPRISPPALRVMAVNTSNMAPTVRDGDYAFVSPLNHYLGEGLYVVDLHGTNHPQIYRVQSYIGQDKIRLSLDSGHYSDVFITRAEFEQIVLGKVAARIETLEPCLIREVMHQFN